MFSLQIFQDFKKQVLEHSKLSSLGLIAISFVFVTSCSLFESTPEQVTVQESPASGSGVAAANGLDNPKEVIAPTPKTENPKEESCADTKMNLAFDLYKRAKYYFGSYYQTRSATDIYFSWYAVQESNAVLNFLSLCKDKKNKHFLATENILKLNQELAKNIRLNLRTPSYGSLTLIFWEEYKKTFPRDIQ